MLKIARSALGSQGHAGIGGIVRTEDGKWVCGFMRAIDHGTNMLAKHNTLLRGLQVVWKKGFRKSISEFDSTEAMHLVNGYSDAFHANDSIIAAIRVRVKGGSRWCG